MPGHVWRCEVWPGVERQGEENKFKIKQMKSKQTITITGPAIFEIGDIICVRRSLTFRKLNAQEIIDSYEYKQFKKNHPQLCKLAEEELEEIE